MDPKTLVTLGTRAYNARDYSTAISYYEQAAELNYPTAFYRLARHYRIGKIVPQNYEKAIQYFEKAIQYGYGPNAYLSLGNMYEKGQGVLQNIPKAISLYIQAAQDPKYASRVKRRIKCRRGNNQGQYNVLDIILDEYIKLAQTKHQLETKIKILQSELSEVKEENIHLKYKPGGPGYDETKNEFECLQNQQATKIFQVLSDGESSELESSQSTDEDSSDN